MEFLAFIVLCGTTFLTAIMLLLCVVGIVLIKKQGKPIDMKVAELKKFVFKDAIYLVIMWALWFLANNI